MSKEKAITFTQEEKSLIYNRFVAPANGTQEEALHFVEYCETLGLNPLLGDVIFQKFDSKFGPKTTFVTTRDGLMRVAVRDENYVGPPVSNVVREGDHFEFLPAEGTVVHKFGQKRGRILGAYAVLYHRRHRPYACWADFPEYFQANAKSQNGKSYIWDQYPSAMIEKVAESFALKRQFPIVGGLTTEEEIGMDTYAAGRMPEAESLEYGRMNVPGSNLQIPKEKDSHEEHGTGSHAVPPSPDGSGKEAGSPSESGQGGSSEADERPDGEEVTVEQVEIGTSQSGIPFAKVFILTQTGQQLLVLAKGKEQVALAKSLNEKEKVRMDIAEENGFHFLKGVKVLA